jgi:hypothetical protein
MNLASTQSRGKPLTTLFGRVQIKSGLLFGIIIITALIAFESFNYSTTDYALRDLLGDLKFIGIPWATILAVAFCGIDFAGIARLFTPEQGQDSPKEVWYLFGAWMLAAMMNAVLTWWGISMAIANHAVASTAVIDAKTLTSVVPVFVALMVWIIRILIIGSLSIAGNRIFSNAPHRSPAYTQSNARPARSSIGSTLPASMASPRLSPRPTNPRHTIHTGIDTTSHPEPTYHSVHARPRPRTDTSSSGEAQSSYRL